MTFLTLQFADADGQVGRAQDTKHKYFVTRLLNKKVELRGKHDQNEVHDSERKFRGFTLTRSNYSYNIRRVSLFRSKTHQ